MIDSKANFNGNDISIKDKWSLSKDGKTLTIYRRFEGPQGKAEQKIIFGKSNSSILPFTKIKLDGQVLMLVTCEFRSSRVPYEVLRFVSHLPAYILAPGFLSSSIGFVAIHQKDSMTMRHGIIALVRAFAPAFAEPVWAPAQIGYSGELEVWRLSHPSMRGYEYFSLHHL